MNSIEQILEEARMRILPRQIHNHDTLAVFFRSWVASSASVNLDELTEEAVRSGLYRHFGAPLWLKTGVRLALPESQRTCGCGT